MHPRTARRLEEAGLAAELDAPGRHVTAPLDYDTLLATLASARLAVTDSGGIQEEAAYLGVPVVVLRASTPRWEGVEAGTTTLAGPGRRRRGRPGARGARSRTPPRPARPARALPCPYGDGTTGVQVAGVLRDERTDALLAP